MGVPLRHLVLPLSGCLSRRTPARATRCEEMGTLVSIRTDPFVDVPPSFFFIWTCRRPGVSSRDGGMVPNASAPLGYTPVGFRSVALLCGHVGR